MSASIYDSAIFRDLMLERETAALFSDTAEVRAMLLVEGALAKAQGTLGLIPELSARAIHRASLELQLDPGGLAQETGRNAVVVPALVAAFREQMQAPEHAQWVHYGATSQDIMDTALVLRLRQVLSLAESRLHAVLSGLADLAERHADLPMAARTYGQVAVPTTFGAVAAGWGQPLLALRERLDRIRHDLLCVSLSGAAGTLSAMGPKGPEVRAALAEGLGLRDPGASWHAARHGMTGLSGWAAEVTAALARMGEDLTLMGQTGINEVRLSASGGSSTMPQKENPVMPSLLVAVARHVAALDGVMKQAAVHRQQRDGAAWISEWMSLPQICLGLARALEVAEGLASGVTPQPDNMRRNLDPGDGFVFAEALQFRLAAEMPRPEAQAAVKALCRETLGTGIPLPRLAAARWPDLDLSPVFTPEAQLGTAPAEARAFAVTVRATA